MAICKPVQAVVTIHSRQAAFRRFCCPTSKSKAISMVTVQWQQHQTFCCPTSRIGWNFLLKELQTLSTFNLQTFLLPNVSSCNGHFFKQRCIHGGCCIITTLLLIPTLHISCNLGKLAQDLLGEQIGDLLCNFSTRSWRSGCRAFTSSGTWPQLWFAPVLSLQFRASRLCLAGIWPSWHQTQGSARFRGVCSTCPSWEVVPSA